MSKARANADATSQTYIENATAAQELSGTYSTERMYFNDSYQLTGDVTVTGHLALGSIADEDVVITQDSTERTITGSGTLESGELLSSKETDLTGMTGTIGSGVRFPQGTIQNVYCSTPTSIAAQALNVAYDTIPTGSSVSYTPTTGARFVVYEYSFSHKNTGVQRAILGMYVQLDSVSYYALNFSYDTGDQPNTDYSVGGNVCRVAINLSTITTQFSGHSSHDWQTKQGGTDAFSAGTLRIIAAKYATDFSTNLHQTQNSGGGTGTVVVVPTVTIYSVM